MPDDLHQAFTSPPAAAEQRIIFAGADIAETFRADEEKRTISGLTVPWGKAALNGMGLWRFAKDSLHFSEPSRIKLNIDHDYSQAIGHAVRLQSTAPGLDATFKVARGDEGNRALQLAEDGVLDGFSIEVKFDAAQGDGFSPDPDDPDVRLVHRATLTGVALTARPAFDDARAERVNATRHSEQGAHSVDPETAELNRPANQQEQNRFLEIMFDKFGERDEERFKAFTEGFTALTAGIVSMLENIDDPQRGGRGTVRASRYTSDGGAPVYSFDGQGPSLVIDTWKAVHHHDIEAENRVKAYRDQIADYNKIASSARFTTPPPMQFATVTTTVGAGLMPTGYRPDLYVEPLEKNRPLVSMLSQGALQNATPFTLPVFTSITGGVATHVEGTNPTDGTLVMGNKTVTPGAVSGRMVVTRELMDSAQPAIDTIVMAAMREAYAQQTEATVYTLLNGANGAGGTITAGFVPSGSQARTSTGGSAAAGTFGGIELLKAVRLALAIYSFRRFADPDSIALSQEATSAFADAQDTTGRPLLPSVGATNTAGIGNAGRGMWNVDGLAARPAWAMTGNAAGDADVFIMNRSDGWAFESPTLLFRYEEKSGPANIELALFGYFATHLLRPVGLVGIRHTVGA